jgi:hypothetical protein
MEGKTQLSKKVFLVTSCIIILFDIAIFIYSVILCATKNGIFGSVGICLSLIAVVVSLIGIYTHKFNDDTKIYLSRTSGFICYFITTFIIQLEVLVLGVTSLNVFYIFKGILYLEVLGSSNGIQIDFYTDEEFSSSLNILSNLIGFGIFLIIVGIFFFTTSLILAGVHMGYDLFVRVCLFLLK